jgi:hypothetical protein
MFFMLAGRAPFAEGTMVQKLLQHQQAEPPAIDELRPDVPRRLAAIIRRLMEKDPLDRYQRPAVLVADLLACAEADGIRLSAPRPAGPVVAAPAPAASRLPWLVPLALLAALVAGLWLRATLERRGGPASRRPPEPVTASLDSPAGSPEEPTPEAGPTRRVTDAANLLAAVAAGGDGETIEIDSDAIIELPRLEIARKRLTMQAAAGRQPVLRFKPAAGAAALELVEGELVIRGLAIHLAGPPRDGGLPAEARLPLFDVRGGRLACEAVVLRMPGDPRSTAIESAAASFVSVGGSEASEVRFVGVRAAGDADLLELTGSASGRVNFSWDAGAVVTPRRLLVLEGSRAGSELVCTLENVVAACGGGIASLQDSAASPVPPRLDLEAAGCRFIVTDPARPFIEQSGIALPEDYAAAVAWRDRHGRYEGGLGFRRIDGAAERIEVSFGDAGVPLVHDTVVGSLPQPSEWAGWED